MKKINFKILVALLVFTANSNAQIVYTDVNPDINYEITWDTFHNIDMNDDETQDFQFEMYSPEAHIGSAVSGNMVASNSDGDAIPYDSGDKIDNTLDWVDASVVTTPYLYASWSTNFANQGDKYIAVQFSINSNTHYGWILVNVTTSQITLKGYAYESTPNNPINAGDTGTIGSVQDFNFNQYFNSYENPVNSILNLEIKKPILINSIDIYNTIGQNTNLNFEVSDSKITMNLNELNEGIYFLKILTKDNLKLTQKLIVKK